MGHIGWNIKETLERVAERQRRYDAAIDAEDDLGAVIRGLTYIDDSLRSLLEWKVPVPKAIQLHKQYGMRLVTFAEALGLIDHDVRCSLESFIELRNSLGHKLERDITEADVQKIVSTLRGEVKEAYEVLVANHADRDNTQGRLRLVIRALNQRIVDLDTARMYDDLHS